MFIDLSVVLNEDTPVYPGDPRTQIKKGGILEKDGYKDHYLCVGTHVGTHIDAPSHMIQGRENIDELSLEKFSGLGVYIKVNNRKFDIKEVKKASPQEGDFVFFDTGMSKHYHESEYYDNYPEMSVEIADYLMGRKVKAVGIDMCSPDHAPFPFHKILLGNNILIIENLTNLEALAGKKFTVFAFPLRLALDGSPVRVVAEIK